MAQLPFRKMHGLGNDFVVLDARARPFALTPEGAQALADRRMGIGCDQVIVIEPARAGGVASLRFWNTNGEEAGACGNGTRCVAGLLMAETGRDEVALETVAGTLRARRREHGRITVDMGTPQLEWNAIPLSRPMDTNALDLQTGLDPAEQAGPASAIGMGNPHCVIFVTDQSKIDVVRHGAALERNPLFPEHANISFAQIMDHTHIRMRVWERGAGTTLACGTAACATLVAAHRRGLTGREAQIVLPGGALSVVWREDGHVDLTGPWVESFTGAVSPSLLTRGHP